MKRCSRVSSWRAGPYLADGSSGRPRERLRWRFAISAALREGDWKLVRLPDRLPMLYHLPSPTMSCDRLTRPVFSAR